MSNKREKWTKSHKIALTSALATILAVAIGFLAWRFPVVINYDIITPAPDSTSLMKNDSIPPEVDIESLMLDIKDIEKITENQYSSAIAFAIYKNYMSLYDDNEFKPDESCTIAQMAKVLYVLNHDIDDGAVIYGHKDFPFDDIPMDYWARGYIAWANEKGYIKDSSLNSFNPEKTITVHDACKMILVNYIFKNETFPLDWDIISDDWIDDSLNNIFKFDKNLHIENMRQKLRRDELAQIIYNFYTITKHSSLPTLSVDFRYTLGGFQYSLPIKLSEYLNREWTLHQKIGVLSPNTKAWIHMDKEDVTVCAYIVNLTTIDLPYSECFLVEEFVQFSDFRPKKTNVFLPGEIEFGVSKLEDIVKAYGGPYEAHDIQDAEERIAYRDASGFEIHMTLSYRSEYDGELEFFRISNPYFLFVGSVK